MTEFLTENARRAYPLEREWPSGMEAWARTVVDASVSADAELGESRLSLLSVTRTGPVLTFNVGVPGTYGVPVTFDRAAWTGGRTAVAYAAGTAEPRPFRAKLDFIESDGTQYVDTGVVFNFAEDLVLSGTVVSLSDNRSVVVGNYGDGRAAINVEFGGTSNGRPRQLRFYTTKQGSPVAERWLGARPPDTLIDFTCAYTEQNATAYVTDGVASATFPLPSGTVAPTTQTLLAFLDGRSNRAQIANGIRMYALEIRQGGVLVRDYVPVLTWDGEVKMFDLASQSYPEHHGTFAGGTAAEATPMPAEPPDPFRAKAFLTLDVEAVDALLAADAAGGEIGVPLATRCSGGAVRRVTGITAQGAAPCERPMYDPGGPHGAEKSVGSNEHAVLRADDGVDLEVTGMAPLVGNVLRVSALAAPEAAELNEEPVDVMIRGDDCFTVETIPGAKVSPGGSVVAREEADGDGGVVKIGTACKPCCQCEDYKDAVDMLRPAETEAAALEGELDAVKDAYETALAAFVSAKEAAKAAVNSLDNVRLAISTAGSSAAYTGSDAEGTRQRFTATLTVANLTMGTAVVGNDLSITTDAAYTAVKTVESGSRTLGPGATLVVVTTFRKKTHVTSNKLDNPPTAHASCTVTLYKPDGTTSSGTKSI